MAWTNEMPPSIAAGWSTEEKQKCVAAANAVLEFSRNEDQALFAGMLAAGKKDLANMRAKAIKDGDDILLAAKLALNAIDHRLEFSNTVEFEAFAPGTWNGLPFTRTDVQEIAANFKALEPYHSVPLKFGHNDKQPMTDGQPALGWVVGARVTEDGKLMLRASDVPNIVARAIKQKLYKKVSVELDVSVEHKGKFYRYVLSGVALLGADIPAVNTLADLNHYLDDKPALAASRRTVFTAIGAGTETKEFTMDEATKKAIADAIAAALGPVREQMTAATAKITQLEAENAQLKRDKEDRDRTAGAEKVTAARGKLNSILEAAVKQSVITPAQRELYTRTFGVNDDAKVLTINPDDFMSMISGGKKIDLTRETASGQGDKIVARKFENVDDEINHRVNVQIAQSGGKLEYRRALDVVLSADPDLAGEYIGQRAA